MACATSLTTICPSIPSPSIHPSISSPSIHDSFYLNPLAHRDVSSAAVVVVCSSSALRKVGIIWWTPTRGCKLRHHSTQVRKQSRGELKLCTLAQSAMNTTIAENITLWSRPLWRPLATVWPSPIVKALTVSVPFNHGLTGVRVMGTMLRYATVLPIKL